LNGRRRRAALAQNFFRRPETVKGLVRLARLVSSDLVYDLGAGSGMITRELAATGARVVAVECDPNLAKILRRRFDGMTNVEVCESSVAQVRFGEPFKVVANIPFNQTAAILRRFYFDGPSPCEAFIVLQREAAEKFAGAGRNRAVSLKLRPWFDFRIVQEFDAHEFIPRPHVAVVLLHIVRRHDRLLHESEQKCWQAFIHYALRRSKADARTTFRNLLSNLQWRYLSRDLGLAADVRLDALRLEDWIEIYAFIRRSVPLRKVRLVFDTNVVSAD
jgi:23S rRNA (adenine-N6)-dimethyltransferase